MELWKLMRSYLFWAEAADVVCGGCGSEWQHWGDPGRHWQSLQNVCCHSSLELHSQPCRHLLWFPPNKWVDLGSGTPEVCLKNPELSPCKHHEMIWCHQSRYKDHSRNPQSGGKIRGEFKGHSTDNEQHSIGSCLHGTAITGQSSEADNVRKVDGAVFIGLWTHQLA